MRCWARPFTLASVSISPPTLCHREAISGSVQAGAGEGLAGRTAYSTLVSCLLPSSSPWESLPNLPPLPIGITLGTLS